MAAEGRKSGRYNVQGASQDLQAVEKFALARSGNLRQATKLVHKMLDKTQHLLSNKATWTAVKVIAEELIEHESISGRAATPFLPPSGPANGWLRGLTENQTPSSRT